MEGIHEMINYEKENTLANSEILLSGIWYSELPPIIDMNHLKSNIKYVMEQLKEDKYDTYKKSQTGIVIDMNSVVSPDYMRQPGVEPIIYYTFKKNHGLREMQIPNLIHYISFIYNSLWVFEDLFEKLYLAGDYSEYVSSSNSYIVFGEEFIINTAGYEDELENSELRGIFVSSNSKIQGSLVMSTNKERYELAAGTYRYGLKMDVESFFPNIYTHYFDKIKTMKPLNAFEGIDNYFTFLDTYHQRINNNQTKGIPAGIFSAHLASELLMLCVDVRIKQEILKDNMGYIRYVDDLTFFSDSKEELSIVASKVQKILNEFRLRINNNKNELFSTVRRIENTNLNEIKSNFLWLLPSNDEATLDYHALDSLKAYIAELLEQKRISQIKTILTLLNKKIKNDNFNVNNMEYSIVCYCQVLILEDLNLACHGYRIIESVMCKIKERQGDLAKYIDLLKNKTNIIDKEYEDTLVQIWHYYVLTGNLNDIEKISFLEERKTEGVIKNPIILAMFVIDGKKKNTKLFKYILDMFKKETNGASDWKQKIMYSRWWLPLYKIWLNDNHNYENFMQTSLFPKVLKDLGKTES